MSKNLLFKLLLLTSLTFVILSPFILEGESIRQVDDSNPKITYFYVSVQLVDLDLVARKIHFTLSGTLGFDFNTSSDIYYISIETMGSYIGTTRMDKINPASNSSAFSINSTESTFDGYFFGGPETYPFDRYSFNFTLIFMQNVSLAPENVSFSQAVDWPLRAQFENPSSVFTSVTQTGSGAAVSVGFSLERSGWRGYATLLPIYFIFALLGFSAFVKIEPKNLTHRIAVYTAILTSALAYSISLQSTLPPGRYYISIPEVLLYGIIAGTTTFLIGTLLAHRFKINLVLADVISVIIAQAFLSFLLLTFYFARYVEIDYAYLVPRMLDMQWIVLGIFSLPVYVSAISDFFALGLERLGFKQLTRRLDNIIKRFYIIAFVLEVFASGIVAFEISVQAGVQPGWLRSQLISAAGNNIWLMIVLQAAFSAVYLSTLYSASTIIRHLTGSNRFNWIRDFFGFLFLVFNISNFLSAFLLFYADAFSIYAASFVTATAGTFVFWVIRPEPPNESYERFTAWLNIQECP